VVTGHLYYITDSGDIDNNNVVNSDMVYLYILVYKGLCIMSLLSRIRFILGVYIVIHKNALVNCL